MGMTLALSALGSRAVRTTIGARRISLNGTRQNDQGGLENIFGGIGKFFGFLGGAIWQALGFASWAATTLWSMFTSAVAFVWNFNWNTSDQELDNVLKAELLKLSGLAGAAVGSTIGWLTCGALPGMLVFSFNEPLGLKILEEVGEEAFEEIAASLGILIRSSFQGIVKVGFAQLYKNVRSLIRGTDSAFAQKLKAQGLSDAQIKALVDQRNKPWSFAKEFDNTLESIPNEFLQTFLEELFEEATDACVEAGYVVAGSIDAFYAQQNQANNQFFGREETVEVTFNRAADNNP